MSCISDLLLLLLLQGILRVIEVLVLHSGCYFFLWLFPSNILGLIGMSETLLVIVDVSNVVLFLLDHAWTDGDGTAANIHEVPFFWWAEINVGVPLQRARVRLHPWHPLHLVACFISAIYLASLILCLHLGRHNVMRNACIGADTLQAGASDETAVAYDHVSSALKCPFQSPHWCR